MPPKLFGKKEADPHQVPKGIDRSTFFNPTIPDEVRACVPFLHNIELSVSTQIITGLVSLWQRPDNVDPRGFVALNNLFKTAPKFATQSPLIITGLSTVIRTCIRNKVRSDQIGSDLKRMNFPEGLISHLIQSFIQNRVGLEAAALNRRVRNPHLNRFRWRIDITMSSGLLSRVMRPSILVEITLSSGIIKTFEISIEQFNLLRYSVAKVLAEMQKIERHPILKLINEDERRDLAARMQ